MNLTYVGNVCMFYDEFFVSIILVQPIRSLSRFENVAVQVLFSKEK